MQLAKLEIKGFKSFADKVVINFDEGITGIVGPNGCGKSNVVDSIRWVLGEQKTSALRSEKMENVIFNGTSGRGAQQMAEVALTINNTKNILPTEYSQITITRRLYRTGESEYLLNGVTCRLKDITNLFLDTGVASNSYAIIQLGMVDDLLNDKDHSRRMLFEEAAGISKFKKRKKETLKKLEDTDADLERVADLQFEIEKNMKSLEKQAKQTETYYRVKDEYKAKSITLAKVVVNRQKDKFDAISKQVQAENDRKIGMAADVAEKEASIEKEKADLVLKEKTLSSRQKAINEFVSKIRQYESEKQIKNERLKYLNDRANGLRDQIEQDKKSNERARFSVQSLEGERGSAEGILEEITQKLERLKGEYEDQKRVTTELQTQTDSLRRVQREKQEESFQINKSVEIREIQVSSFKQELEKTASDTSLQNASLVEFENKLKVLQEELDKGNAQQDRLKKEEEEVQSRITAMEKTIEMIREEMNVTGRKLDARQNEYNLTKSLVENLEGFPEAIKFLKKKVGKNAPLLSDILTTSEEYRVAIENYLEQYLNYYIVEHESEAYEAINILSDAAKGKAHFFILDSFEKFEPTPGRIYDNAFPATEIIEYDQKYRKLMAYILDKVYIIEGDMKQLPVSDDNTFITKNGKLTKRKFSISGGSVGLFEGKKIGRAKNMEKLEKEIKELTAKLDDIRHSLLEKQADLEKLRNNKIRQQIDEVQNTLRQVNEEYVSFRTKREQFADMLNSADLRREDILEKIDTLRQELEDLRPKAQQIQRDYEAQEERLADIAQDLASNNELLTQKSAAYNEQNIFFHQQDNRVKSIDQEIRFKQESMEQSAGRIDVNVEELKKNEEEVKRIIENTESNDDELLGMYEEKEAMEKGLAEAEKEYYEARGAIDKVEKSLREIQHQRQAIDNTLIELQGQLNESKMHLNSVKERLSVEFNVDLDTVVGEATPEEAEQLSAMDEVKIREEVQKIRNRLDNMGPINPMAMEAYTEIKQRNDFIMAQKDDLVKAKESLMSTIGEIEGVASATFMESFNKIKEHFVRVFRSLFTEDDQCDLRLVDPNNPLESEIDIIAKPKGKRPLTINQLSGGEKTLTATALLFSMYLLKPAPFCIFDEVDAPLDDANIDKFNNIIRTFSKDSQFVIVTHNKRTMTSTDVIYGITMVEKGVSRVVPVDLREMV
ncbi:chromosome segregation protein SMC [Parachryseolinea silvisoli]|uniref:chromosome segregation protein SMC n=1 Tax=Parachryseolinea silvisoli TaxID=2873601 RepID=UPI002265DDFF|nr:chromosome segregation protein SMC [Parachryseolinea silvisoli]MCD9019649.1 chromosome segregation protein SMC [Parachryseolinea silvisoli]